MRSQPWTEGQVQQLVQKSFDSKKYSAVCFEQAVTLWCEELLSFADSTGWGDDELRAVAEVAVLRKVADRCWNRAYRLENENFVKNRTPWEDVARCGAHFSDVNPCF